MDPRVRHAGLWLYRRGENLLAAMLLAMFAAFILQIIFRYLLNFPVGWTNEISVVLWIWIVLFGAAFVVREDEEIRFDLIYAAAGASARRIMFVIAAISLIALYGISIPAAADYVIFMKVEKTAYLKIRFDWLFSIYLLFVVAIIARYLWLTWQALFGRRTGGLRSDEGRVRHMSLASPFSLCVAAMTALAFLGLPIGHAMIAGSILYLALAGLDMGTAAEQLLNGMYSNYIILAVPLFILAAELMNIGSMTDRLLTFCNAVVGRFRGGLAYVNIVQSIIFAGMSGSAIADAAGTGKLMQQMMVKDGKYPASYAAALTAVTAVIGPIIPPSIPMIIYALVSDASIGYLFLGGVVPGLLMAFAQMVIVFFDARRKNFPVEDPTPLRELPLVTWRAFPALMMPVVLLGGIYSGVTTPTEAAAVAAAYALLVSVVLYRSVQFADFYRSVLASARTTASIGMLIAGALVFNYVVTVENIPQSLSAILRTRDFSPLGFLILVNVILLILGCVLEGTTILLVVVPVLIPTAQALGVDMVHFGVVVVVNIMLGLITPPYGLLLFIMTRIAEVPLRALVRDTMPFLGAMVVALVLITLFPGLVLWLPRVFGYGG